MVVNYLNVINAIILKIISPKMQFFLEKSNSTLILQKYDVLHDIMILEFLKKYLKPVIAHILQKT